MTNLAPARDVCHFNPQWVIEIHSTKYSYETAQPSDTNERGNSVEGALGLGFNPLDSGWIRLDCGATINPATGDIISGQIGLYDVNIKWDIHDKPTGEIVIDENTRDWLGIDIIGKAKASAFYPSTPDLTVFPINSPVVFFVNTKGIADCYAQGTVSVTGKLSSGIIHTETINVNGDGAYPTQYLYKEVSEFDADFNNDPGYQGGLATVSVWAKINPSCGVREVRIWCDANEDGWYGCIFGGYIRPRYGEVSVRLNDMRATYDLVGYAEVLQINEYVAGYRGMYRCTNFSDTGQYGDCTSTIYKPTNWRQGASTCYLGDWRPIHHNGTLVNDTGYTCPGYTADYNKPLATDGWTYDQNYAPSTDPNYAWYPYDYYLALQACCDMINSIEACQGKAVSSPFSLPLAARSTLNENLTENDEMVDLAWDRRGTLSKFKKYSFIVCEGEVMLIRVGTGTNINDSLSPMNRNGATIGVTRGVESSLQTSHDKDAVVDIPLICWSGYDPVPPRLVINNVLQEPKIKHTVMDTLEALAEQATCQLNNALYVAWVDCYRQIHFTDLDPTRPTVSGLDDHFTILPSDIIEPPTYMLSGIVNRVVGQVDIDESNWIYAELDVNSTGLEAYKDSIKLFGVCTEEVSKVHLTALKPTTGCADFQSYAMNYLKVNSYPHLIEHIAVNGFIPDEHDWEHVTDVRTDTEDHRYDPYLNWTDPVNQHINILGMKVTAPDFWKGRDPNDEHNDWYQSDFIIEGVRWVAKVEGRREFVTFLSLSRPTLPSEWSPVL